MNLPDDILNIIGEYASLSIETKKYKRRCNANKMKITKIKYKCHLCSNKYNKNQISERFLCKYCEECSYTRVEKYWDKCRIYLLSFRMSDIFGSKWYNHFLKMRVVSRIKNGGVYPLDVRKHLFLSYMENDFKDDFRLQFEPL